MTLSIVISLLTFSWRVFIAMHFTMWLHAPSLLTETTLAKLSSAEPCLWCILDHLDLAKSTISHHCVRTCSVDCNFLVRLQATVLAVLRDLPSVSASCLQQAHMTANEGAALIVQFLNACRQLSWKSLWFAKCFCVMSSARSLTLLKLLPWGM